MLDLHRLALLHEFSVRGSIAATAESLGYSPSAISQQLTTLERETGAVLLERTARSASLTDAGRLLARHARLLLRGSEEAEAALSAQLDRVSGSLVITTIPSTAAAVATAVVQIQREHPDVEIVMRQSLSEGAATTVVEHTTDIAVTDDWSTRPRRAPEGLTRRNITTEPIVLAVPHAHPLATSHRQSAEGQPAESQPAEREPAESESAERRLTMRELAAAVPQMTWLCSPEGHPSRIAGDRLLDELGVRPRVRWEFEGLATLAELVAEGSGCALLPQTVATTQPASRLHALELTPAQQRHVHILMRSSTRTSRTVAACVAAITEHLRNRSDP